MEYYNENNYINGYSQAKDNYYQNSYPPAYEKQYTYEPTNYSNGATYYTTQFKKPTYNINENLYQTRIAENTNQSMLNEALEMIRNSVLNELEDELFYSALINQAIDQEDKEIIMSIRDNEIKHNKILRDVYYSLTGTSLPQPRQTNEMGAQTYIQNLKKALMGEIEAADKYRKILVAMPDKQNMFHILEILVDELRHADKYNYLLTKNKISKLAPPA